MFRPATLLCLSLLAFGSLPANAADPLVKTIDEHVAKKLAAENVQPTPRAADTTLVRRLYLDLAGRIPSPREVRNFVESTDADKTEKLVDRLMASPEYHEQMAREFDVFMTQGNGSIRDYLQIAFRENYGWDRVFREIMLGDPEDETQKLAYEFLKRRASDADKLTNDTSAVFFGINVTCMKCHDHPLVEGWYQGHFYGMKSFFNRTFVNGDYVAERDHGRVEYEDVVGVKHQAQLMFLTGTVVEEPEAKERTKEDEKREKEFFEKLKKDKKPAPAPEFSRRSQLVDLVLEKGQNDFFAKSVANRVWHQFVGHGIVMPLDQMHAGNPPSHPELLDALAKDLAANDYDLRRLVRAIVLSDVYARSSQWTSDERPDAALFAVANVKPLTPTQYARSLALGTRDPNELEKDDPNEVAERSRSAASAGNSNWFEQPGEAFAIGADEALRVTNDPGFENYLRGGLFNHLKKIEENGELVDAATRSVLCRPATDEEMKVLGSYLATRGDRREAAIQQVLWALLAGTEARFNH